jgi:hypothetical protein
VFDVIILILLFPILLDFLKSSIASYTTPFIVGTLLIKESKLKALDMIFLPYFHC